LEYHSGLCNLKYGGGTRRIKKYFHILYGGARRTYGGAGRKISSSSNPGPKPNLGPTDSPTQLNSGFFFLHPHVFLPAPPQF